jgi:hypothetical protein
MSLRDPGIILPNQHDFPLVIVNGSRVGHMTQAGQFSPLYFSNKLVDIMKNMRPEWSVAHFFCRPPTIEMRDRWAIIQNTLVKF